MFIPLRGFSWIAFFLITVIFLRALCFMLCHRFASRAWFTLLSFAVLYSLVNSNQSFRRSKGFVTYSTLCFSTSLVKSLELINSMVSLNVKEFIENLLGLASS